MLVFVEREKPQNPEKNPRSKGDNHEQIQPNNMAPDPSPARTTSLTPSIDLSPCYLLLEVTCPTTSYSQYQIGHFLAADF